VDEIANACPQQLAWIIAFISSIIAQVQSRGFPAYTWWTVVYMLFVIIGIFVTVASDSTNIYSVAIVGYLACGLVLTTSSVNALVYSPNGAREAAAAGFILLSMVTVCTLDCLHPTLHTAHGPLPAAHEQALLT